MNFNEVGIFTRKPMRNIDWVFSILYCHNYTVNEIKNRMFDCIN